MIDMTSFEAALKSYYISQRIKNMVYKKNPLLAMVPKSESFPGKNLPIPIIYGNPQGRSATFTTARNNKGSTSLVEDFVLTRVKNYGLADIDNETMEASADDKGAFLRAATLEIDGVLHNLGRNLAIDLFSDGSGRIGTIASGQATDTVTLTNLSDITNFEVGMVLKVGSSLTAAVENGTVTVEAVNRTTGQLRCTAATWAAGIPTVAAGMFIFVEGDARNAGDTKKVTGLAGWLDPDATSTPFFSVDRTVDITRLAGQYYDGTADTVEEALLSGLSHCGREGGSPEHVFLNNVHYVELIKELGSKVQYTRVDVPKANVGFDGIQIHGVHGSATVIADHNCPVGRAYGLELETWKLYSLGGAPRILNQDGNRWLRNSDSDSVEVRAGYYAQLGCHAPGNNVRIDLAT